MGVYMIQDDTGRWLRGVGNTCTSFDWETKMEKGTLFHSKEAAEVALERLRGSYVAEPAFVHLIGFRLEPVDSTVYDRRIKNYIMREAWRRL